MLTKLIDWLRKLFHTDDPPEGTIVRTPERAAAMRYEALHTVEAESYGIITCPFCNLTDEKTLSFTKRGGTYSNSGSSTFHCSKCHRTGSVETLTNRLRDYAVYRRAIE